MERQLWVKRVADRLYAGEAKVDESMRAIMELVQEVQAAQADMNLSAVTVDGTLTKLVEGLSALQTARTALVGGHRRLEKTAHDLGLRTTGIGGDPVKPPPTVEDVDADLQRIAV
jgi:hypothetical protein